MNHPHESAIRIDECPHPQAPWLILGRMKSRLAFTPLGNPCLLTNGIEGVKIIEPQATAKPARERIKLRMRKELQR